MEPQLSVLLYSKYSPISKKLMDLIQSSQVDFSSLFSLQTLCVDNEKIRNRILDNAQLDITSVPCVLLIYPDGGIEKYDQSHVFEWVEQIINKFAPPPPPPELSTSQKTYEQSDKVKEQRVIEEKELIKHEREKLREKQRKKYEDHIGNKSSPNDSRKIEIEPHSSEKEVDEVIGTRIEDLDSDYKTDRHRNRKPIGSIREDSGNYTLDDDLFSGSPSDMRRPKRGTIKGISKSSSDQKSMDIMTKAKELAKGREESDYRPPPGHPSGNRL